MRIFESTGPDSRIRRGALQGAQCVRLGRTAEWYQDLVQLAHGPATFVKGEFVGGCDIVREMLPAGELQQLFIEKGTSHPSAGELTNQSIEDCR